MELVLTGPHVERAGGRCVGHDQDGEGVDGDDILVQTTVLGRIRPFLTLKPGLKRKPSPAQPEPSTRARFRVL